MVVTYSNHHQLPPQVRVPGHLTGADRDRFLVLARQALGRLRPRYSGPDRGMFSETQVQFASYRAGQLLERER